MSFSLEVKSELSRIEEIGVCCKKSELAGIIRAGLGIRSARGKERLIFATQNAPLSRHLFARVKELYHTGPEVIMLKTRRFRTHAIYRLDFTGFLDHQEDGLLRDMGLKIEADLSGIAYQHIALKNRCCKRAYLRGGFMATGSISDPDKSYHLEITFSNRVQAKEYMHYLKDFGIDSRSILRKGHYLVYLKEGQEIVDFLNVTGAHGALMSLENIRILKEMRNQVNRIVNCETANLSKTVDASFRQGESIWYIKDHAGLESLPKGLYEIAVIRLENPDVSLSELGGMLNPTLSKSGVNHRLRKIDRIAEELKHGQNI